MCFHAAMMRLLGVVVGTLISGHACAQVTSTNLGVQITIIGGCTIQNVSDVNFGSRALLNANIDTTGSFEVLCTSGVPYSLSLNGGGANLVSARRMIQGAQTISYQLYRDIGHTLLWGETLNVDRLTGTGNGSPQVQTVYARVPPQVTPVLGTYTDTVTVTIDF